MTDPCSFCGPFPEGDRGFKPPASARFLAHIESTRRIVPGPGIPASIEPGFSNNNLDVVRHDGRVYLVWRSAPNHFASKATRIFVVSSDDERHWRREAEFGVADAAILEGNDLREPRLVSMGGRLLLFISVLGGSEQAFEPKGTLVVARDAAGWGASKKFRGDARVVWRTKRVGERAWMSYYTGGQNIYRPISEVGELPALEQIASLLFPLPLRSGQVRTLLARSDDGEHWHDQALMNVGGASETAFEFLEDGRAVAVARCELPEDGRTGSLLLISRDDTLHTWDKVIVPQKFDSPLMFRWRGELFLIGRRTLAHGGKYATNPNVDHVNEYMILQQQYSCSFKRSALWHVRTDGIPRGGSNLAEGLAVEWIGDLPSAGDTCFAGVLAPTDDGVLVVYDYSAPLNAREEPRWCEAQKHLTHIYRHEVRLESISGGTP